MGGDHQRNSEFQTRREFLQHMIPLSQGDEGQEEE